MFLIVDLLLLIFVDVQRQGEAKADESGALLFPDCLCLKYVQKRSKSTDVGYPDPPSSFFLPDESLFSA